MSHASSKNRHMTLMADVSCCIRRQVVDSSVILQQSANENELLEPALFRRQLFLGILPWMISVVSCWVSLSMNYP